MGGIGIEFRPPAVDFYGAPLAYRLDLGLGKGRTAGKLDFDFGGRVCCGGFVMCTVCQSWVAVLVRCNVCFEVLVVWSTRIQIENYGVCFAFLEGNL